MVTTTSVLSSDCSAGIGSVWSGITSSPSGNSAAASISATMCSVSPSLASSSTTQRGLVCTSASPASSTRLRVLRIADRSFTSVPTSRSSPSGSHIRSTSNTSCCRSATAIRLARPKSSSLNRPVVVQVGAGLRLGDQLVGRQGARLRRPSGPARRAYGLSSGSSHSLASGPDGSRMIVGSPRRAAL